MAGYTFNPLIFSGLQPPSTGGGGGGGANTFLSNLTNPTAINRDLIFNTGAAATIKTKDSAGITQALNITTGNSSGDETGPIQIFPGASSVASNAGVNIFTQDAVADDLDTGGLNFSTGGASGIGNSGNIIFGTGPVAGGTQGTIQFNSDIFMGAALDINGNFINNVGHIKSGARNFDLNADSNFDVNISASGTGKVNFSSDVAPTINAQYGLGTVDDKQWIRVATYSVTAGTNALQLAGTSIGVNNLNVKDAADPVDPQDLATKAYVDGSTNSGANKTLSNLDSPTAVNQDLIFNTAIDPRLKSQDESSVSTKNLYVITGDASGAHDSGELLLQTGTGQSTGSLSILTGNPTADDFNSGTLRIDTGETTGVGVSGSVIITSGDSENGQSGLISLETGTPSGSDSSGVISLTTGRTAGGSGTGDITINTGAPTASNINSGGVVSATGAVNGSGQSGLFQFISGNSENGPSGAFNLGTGSVIGSATSGAISMFTGNNAGSGNSGQVGIQSGATDTGNSGSVAIQSGNVTSAGTSGPISINSGAGGGATGTVDVFSGDPASANFDSGNVSFRSGAASGTGVSGILLLSSGITEHSASGDVFLQSGSTTGNGNSGSLSIVSSNVGGNGNSGDIVISTGSAGLGNSGTITLQTAVPSSGTQGKITLSALSLALPQQPSDPTGVAGDIYYNSISNKIRWNNGSVWADL